MPRTSKHLLLLYCTVYKMPEGCKLKPHKESDILFFKIMNFLYGKECNCARKEITLSSHDFVCWVISCALAIFYDRLSLFSSCCNSLLAVYVLKTCQGRNLFSPSFRDRATIWLQKAQQSNKR